MRALCTAMAALMLSTSAGAAPDLQCRMRWLQPGQRLQFELYNRGPEAVALLRWGSPFEGGWWAPFVRVWHQEIALPYRGASAKRGEPEAADYLLIAPGQRRRASVRLAEVYPLDAPGDYRLEAGWTWHDHGPPARMPRPRDAHQAQGMHCGALRWKR
jgi:hypothetical protein